MSDFDRLREVAMESRLWRAWVAASSAAAAAWTESFTARAIDVVIRQTREGTVAERVQHGAVAIAIAIAVYVASLAILPAYVISGLPLALYALFAVAALIVAIFATPLADAWPNSQLRRLIGLSRDADDPAS